MKHRLLICLSFFLILPGTATLPAQEIAPLEGEETGQPPIITLPFDFLPTPAEPEEFEWLRAEGFDPVICPFRGRIDYEPGQIECGLIRVPENREVPDSRTIELHFVRILARGEDHEGNDVETREDPVVYLTGGPGVTVEGYVRALKDHRLMGKRDLYILEQRGIGHSGDFCPFGMNRNRAEQIQEDFLAAQRASLAVTRQCIEDARAQGVDVTGYHTFENARDLKALRLALGLPEWNVWGISYGSVLGQAYMKVDPDGIRSAVLDAIVPLDLEDLMRIAHWHDQNLERLFGACRQQDECARVFDDLEERYLAAIERMNAESIGVEVPADERYPGGQAWFHPDLVVGLPFGLLYEQSAHPAIPAIMDGLARAVERRDETLFRALALAEGGGDGFAVSMGMSTAIRCLDGYVDRWAEALPGDWQDYPLLAPAFGSLELIQDLPRMCRETGLLPRDTGGFALVETDLPVLVANGAWDPITPVPLAEYIMPGFENGQLVVFPHAGHGPTRSIPCAGDWMNDYFDDPLAPAGDECVEEGEEAARYLAPYFRTSALPRGIIMNAEAETRLQAHSIWGGVSALLVLAGWITLLLAWLARRLNRQRLTPAGGSRFILFLAGLAGLAWAGGMAVAARATAEVSEAMLLFGLVGWAQWVAWLAPIAGLLGLVGLLQSWRYRPGITLATRLGLVVTALATISLSVFALYWGLWPF